MKRFCLYIILFVSLSLKGQERNISGFINTDLVFYSDTTYIFNFNCRISSSASLIVNPGAQVKFASGASVIVDGDIYLNGTKEYPISLTSTDLNFQGIGFVISGNNGKEVVATYSNFSNLLIPLTFKDNWFRQRVFLYHNIFKEINTGQPAIYVGNASQLPYIDKAIFDFRYNNFIENNATIFFSNIEDDNIIYSFKNNLIASNIVLSKEVSNPLNAPFSFNFDQRNRKHLISFNENSILNNQIISSNNINDFKLLSIGVKGSGESIELTENFIGDNAQNKTLMHFYQNNNLPLILLINNKKNPAEDINIHLYKLMIYKDNKWVIWDKSDNIYYDELKLKLMFNREISSSQQNLDLIKFNNDSIRHEIINVNIDERDQNNIYITVRNINLQQDVLELLEVIDSENNTSPKYFIGNTNTYHLLRYGRYDEFKVLDEVFEERMVNDKLMITSDSIKETRYKIATSVTLPFMRNADYIETNFGYSMSAGLRLNDELFTNIELSSFFSTEKDYNIDFSALHSNVEVKLETLQKLFTLISFRVGAGVLLKNKNKKINGYLTSSERTSYLLFPSEFMFETTLSSDFSIAGGISYSKVFSEENNDFYVLKLAIIKTIK